MLLLYILRDDWLIFMISGSNEQLQQQLEYTSGWISKMQSGREDTLEKRYAIKFSSKLGKNATETYGMLQAVFRPCRMNRASIFEWHKRFKEGSLWGMIRCVGGVRKYVLYRFITNIIRTQKKKNHDIHTAVYRPNVYLGGVISVTVMVERSGIDKSTSNPRSIITELRELI